RLPHRGHAHLADRRDDPRPDRGADAQRHARVLPAHDPLAGSGGDGLAALGPRGFPRAPWAGALEAEALRGLAVRIDLPAVRVLLLAIGVLALRARILLLAV